MSTVLLLGATSDMAMAIAEKYASKGFNLILAARNPERLNPVCSDLAIRFNIDAQPVSFDACDTGSHPDFFHSLQTIPDITICVFGYLGDQKMAEENWEEAERIINANYTGAVSILNIVASAYEKQGKGTIIGISSVAGERGRQSNYIYGSAKAGFSAYLSGLRNRLFKSNVHVLSVQPGFVYTRMTRELALPPLLTAQPADVAAAAYKAAERQKNVIYVKWFWRWIMLIIKLIPEGIFKKLKL